MNNTETYPTKQELLRKIHEKDEEMGFYVFRYNGATWDQEAKLTALEPAAGDFFGFSVAVAATGDTAVVGAPFDDNVDCENEPEPPCLLDPEGLPLDPEVNGSAYVFRYDGTAWLEDEYLTAVDDGAEGDSFGMAVAIAADGTVFVGADLHDHEPGMAACNIEVPDTCGAGSVYVLLPEPSVRALHTIAIAVLWGIARRSRRRQTQR